MLKPRSLPDLDRLSVLAATILLAYALARFINLPVQDLSLQLPGIFLPIRITVNTIVALLVAGLTASGADWLLHDHPNLRETQTFQHWILPALTAWVIGIPLFELPLSVLWWVVFAIGGLLLMFVLVAEYIAVDPEDTIYNVAVIGLTAVASGLFLILAIVLHSMQVRLYLLLPALFLAAVLVSVRMLRLRLLGQWKLWEALVIGLVVGQVAAALHYWPLSPIAFGLLVLAPAYALTGFLSGLREGRTLRQSLLEPGIVVIVLVGAALWMR